MQGACTCRKPPGMSLWQMEPFFQSPESTPRFGCLCSARRQKHLTAGCLMPRDGLLVSNEVIRSRVPVLTQNIARWGTQMLWNTKRPQAFTGLQGYFDVLVTDVPCSGEGLFRPEPGSQKQLVFGSCGSMCDATAKNSWRFVAFTAGRRFVAIRVHARLTGKTNNRWNGFAKAGSPHPSRPGKILSPSHQGWRIFMALLKSRKTHKHRAQWDSRHAPEARGIRKSSRLRNTWLLKEDYVYAMKGPLLKAFPALWHQEMTGMEKVLNVVHSGIAVAERKGTTGYPRPILPWLLIWRKTLYSLWSWSSRSDRFLRRDSPDIAGGNEKRFVLIIYEDFPLGFVKNLKLFQQPASNILQNLDAGRPFKHNKINIFIVKF